MAALEELGALEEPTMAALEELAPSEADAIRARLLVLPSRLSMALELAKPAAALLGVTTGAEELANVAAEERTLG